MRLVRLAVIALLAGALPFVEARAVEPFVDMEVGVAWAGYNDVQIPGDTGTRFSLTDDLQASAAPYFRVRLGASFAGRHTLFAFFTPAGRRAVTYWRRVEEERKRPLRLVVGALGWPAIVAYALGRVTLEAGVRRVSRRLGLRAGIVILPFPEAAVDVDSADDLQLVRAIVGPTG